MLLSTQRTESFMRKTALYEQHKLLNANFDQMYDGWFLVSHYNDSVQEHLAVRNGIGIIDVSHRGRLRLTGTERAEYLHRIVSNEVTKLPSGGGNYAMILTNRGKIIADMNVIVAEDYIDLITDAIAKEDLHRNLDKYLIADDVEINDITAETGIILVSGVNSGSFIESLLGVDVANLEEYQSVNGKIVDLSVKCVSSLETGEVGFQLHVNSASELSDLWQVLIAEGKSFGVVPVGLKALNSLRLEAGIPWFGNELDDSIIPLEAELEKAVNFEKGCYIGQEIVARMKYRGHPNRLLRGLEIDSEDLPSEKAVIRSGEKQIGYVTSVVKSPTLNKTIALGYVRMAFTEHGSEVEIEIENEWVNAIVSSLPFMEKA